MRKPIPAYVVQPASDLALDPAVLAAVVHVESGGRTTVRIGGRDLPVIRYEHHVAYRVAARRGVLTEFIAAGLASAKWDKSLAAKTVTGAWEIYERACEVDAETAAQACSWGVGQVLGENAKWIGYRSGVAIAARACSGVEGQVEIMARFIEANRLALVLRRHDWAEFARRYNGPGYAANRYDQKLAEAFAMFSGAVVEPFEPAKKPATEPASEPAKPSLWARIWNWIKRNTKEPEL